MNSSTNRPPYPSGGDSFSNLISFGRAKPTPGNLSLLEQQKLLQARKAREEQERREKLDAMFGGGNDGFWNSLETGRPPSSAPPVVVAAKEVEEDEEDILAAFTSSAPVDSSSYFPPPGRNGTPVVAPPADPFDLENLPSRDASPFRPLPSGGNVFGDDDDILGDLAKPVGELPGRVAVPAETEEMDRRADPRDGAIAEMVEMGFSVSQAKRALAETDTGLDVEGAVGWLLEDAHRKSSSRNPWEGDVVGSRRGHGEEGAAALARGRDTAQGEKDIGQFASDIGGTLFKSANSLWNTGKKKVGKAIAELQDGGGNTTGDGAPEAGMPKWMRDQHIHQVETIIGPSRPREKAGKDRFVAEDIRPPRAALGETSEPALTEEALMLEVGSGPPTRRRQGRETASTLPHSQPLPDKEKVQQQRQQALEAAIRDKERELRERERIRRAAPAIPNSTDRRAKLTRRAVEEDSATQYVSRNRRRPPPSSATSSIASSSKPATPEPPQVDLLFGGGQAASAPRGQSRNPFLQLQQQQQQQQRQTAASPPKRQTPNTTPPTAHRPAATRPIIPASPSALQSSSLSRQKGSEAFKRGDYPTALTHYTTALTPLPPSHLHRILILSNRSLCSLKIGDPKSALLDCDEALAIIGPTNGQGEHITLQDGTKKDMKALFSKTLTRKAEGLEHLERWPDALKVWTQAVESGAGGAIAVSGRRRCENALRPKAKPSQPPPRPTPTAKPTPAKTEAATVTALRQANAASDKLLEEKLALHDVVTDRINAWKSGKEGNLRALLASLDTVLWPDAGWKKVGMGELLLPGKCKVVYMKGISKVHPDKISVTATTEQKMVSAAVFTLLNEAWDRFKVENGL